MRGDRALWVALAVAAVAFAAHQLHQRGPDGLAWLPGCFFKRITGLNCPGCGMTRAAYATLHGHFAAAFRYNPVGMVLLPLALLGVAIELLGWIRARPLGHRLSVGVRGAKWIAWLMVSFWILRNIPLWPLTLLAPPE
jgi:Protein of unknown function (DUF2752)